ncbi:MAG TPA: GvpL/GvpF family gas vesicle protein [Pyrinomonadaceae bacterium]|nr:GvpL/GvpF family gas vesicle protein [Pyrinomonadaceae bacterium]
MSDHLQRAPEKRVGPSGIYVYCIAEAGPAKAIAAEPLPAAIEDDAALELIGVDDFMAVTSNVPLSMYGEESLEDNLIDPTWTAIRAMRHERVVEHFAKRTGVVPLRFGTIYLARDGVERMLSEKAEDFREIIQRVGQSEEWGVNVFSDREKLLNAITELSPKLRELSEQARNTSPGQAYLLQKKTEGLRTEEARSELARIIDNIEARLIEKTKAGKRLRVLKVEATESGELKAKFALLVEKTHFDDFREEAEKIAKEVDKIGIRLELTGPWPTYNFAS